jgi:hypothetical protein
MTQEIQASWDKTETQGGISDDKIRLWEWSTHTHIDVHNMQKVNSAMKT